MESCKFNIGIRQSDLKNKTTIKNVWIKLYNRLLKRNSVTINLNHYQTNLKLDAFRSDWINLELFNCEKNKINKLIEILDWSKDYEIIIREKI